MTMLRLRWELISRGLTQTRVSLDTGIPQVTLNKIVNGKPATGEQARVLGEYFGCESLFETVCPAIPEVPEDVSR
jgi:plasmid maintenance system antidote protein VapI